LFTNKIGFCYVLLMPSYAKSIEEDGTKEEEMVY